MPKPIAPGIRLRLPGLIDETCGPVHPTNIPAGLDVLGFPTEIIGVGTATKDRCLVICARPPRHLRGRKPVVIVDWLPRERWPAVKLAGKMHPGGEVVWLVSGLPCMNCLMPREEGDEPCPDPCPVCNGTKLQPQVENVKETVARIEAAAARETAAKAAEEAKEREAAEVIAQERARLRAANEG